MATVKSYTDIEQSRKLAEILPLESADMWYSIYGNPTYNPTIAYEGQQWFLCQIRISRHNDIPCWSLAALISVMPTEIVYKGNIIFLEFHVWENSFEYVNGADYTLHVTESYDNPIDACYEMVLKLHGLNFL